MANKLKFGTETPSKLYVGETEVTKAYLGDKLVYEAKSPTSTGETWVLNNSLNTSSNDLSLTSINFTCNGVQYIELKSTGTGIDSMEKSLYYYTSDNNQILVYSDVTGQGWVDTKYRTITFDTAPTGDLLTWLQQNGTKQGEPSTTTYTLTFNRDDTSIGYAITRDGEYVHSPCTAKSGDVFVFEAIKMTNTINGVSYNSSDLTGIMTFSEDVTIVGSSGPQIVLTSGQSFSITFK